MPLAPLRAPLGAPAPLGALRPSAPMTLGAPAPSAPPRPRRPRALGAHDPRRLSCTACRLQHVYDGAL